VARALRKRLISTREAADVLTYSDEPKLLRSLGFDSEVRDLTDLARSLSDGPRDQDWIFLDTIPLRRQELILPLVASLRRVSRRKIVCGHTGWLEGTYLEDVLWWRELLAFMKVSAVVLYHGVDVCEGGCDIGRIAGFLGIPVMHNGILLPETPRRSTPPTPRTLAMSMGGGVKGEETVTLALLLATQNPDWRIDLYLGPYARVSREGHDGLVFKNFEPNFAPALSRYEGAIARSGYGSCMDHIAAKIPTLFLPIHEEQQSNARWARRFVPGQVRIDANYNISVEPSGCAILPQIFNWLDVDAAFQTC
jgi:hypothetical protein